MNEVSIGTLALSALYLIVTYHYFGMTASISETFYKWKTRDYSAAFVWFCLTITLGAWLQALYPLKHETKAILMLAGLFIFCVGVAATYKDGKTATWHYVFAMLAILLGFLALIVEFWGEWRCWVPFSAFVVLSAATRKFWPRYTTYLVEVYAIILIFTFL